MNEWIRIVNKRNTGAPSYPEIKEALSKCGYTVLEYAFGSPIRANALEVYDIRNQKFQKVRYAEFGRALDMVNKYKDELIAVQSWRGPIYIQLDRTTYPSITDATEHIKYILNVYDEQIEKIEYIDNEQMMRNIKSTFDII